MLKFSRMLQLRTIDAPAAGEPLRLIVEGFPSPRGKTMLDKREWVKRHADHLRRALMLEPRGHADMYGAILTEPVAPGSHAGVLFMHNEGYSTMCGHGIIAVTTVALQRGLMVVPDGCAAVVYDTPAGTVRAAARWGERTGEGEGAGEGGAGGRGRSVAVVQRAVVRSSCRRSGETAIAHRAGGRGIRRRLLCHRRQRISGAANRCGAPSRLAPRGNGDQARDRGAAVDRSSGRCGAARHLRHDL